MPQILNQKGIAQIVLFVILLLGLAVVLTAVKTQTNLFPKAYEQNIAEYSSEESVDDYKGGVKKIR